MTMVNRLVSVGDDFTLPPAVKAADANLPARLQPTALNATIGERIAAEDIPGQVTDAVAASPTVTAAAASAVTAEVAAQDLVSHSDPGIPEILATDRDGEYYAATRWATGDIVEAVSLQGHKVFPKAEIGGAVQEAYASTDYIKGTRFSDGTAAEDALDLSGRVPQWVLDSWSSRMGVSTSTLPVDIVIVAGQSNATERSSLPATVGETDSRVLQWNSGTSLMEVVPASATQWIGNEFAREYVKNVPGRRVLIVPAALGSTGFTTTSVTPPAAGYTYVSGGGTWDRNLTADPVNLPAQLLAKTQAALAAAGAGARIVGMLWSQGESDRGTMTQAQYAAAVDDLFSHIRTTLALPTLPIVLGSMTPETIWDGGSTTQDIHKAILDTPRRVLNTSYVWGPPNHVEYQNSRVHWTPQGQAIRARVMARDGLYRAKLNLAAAKPVQPQNLKVTRSAADVFITWDASPARVTSYTLEVSTDSGATWTAQTLISPIITEHQTTATATLPVWVRAKTTNDVGVSDWTREAKA